LPLNDRKGRQQTPLKAGGVFFPTVTNAFERRSHARCACYFFVFAFLLQTAMSYHGINRIHAEN
jgi:hypothetical protein